MILNWAQASLGYEVQRKASTDKLAVVCLMREEAEEGTHCMPDFAQCCHCVSAAY